MMTNLVSAGFLLLALVLQSAGIASLPDPWRLFPLVFVLGVIVLHERSLLLGASWIALSGIILELRGLGDGLAFAAIVAAATAVGLSLSVFAKRSFWALLGIGMGSVFGYVIARFVWLGSFALLTGSNLRLQAEMHEATATIFLAGLGLTFFGAYVRRFLRWSRDKFVSKGQLYDISFPQ
ncbi:MAG TPA: hypothetical protein PLK06_01445 [bacterium]|nr:hypothetical protein [bacterium]